MIALLIILGWVLLGVFEYGFLNMFEDGRSRLNHDDIGPVIAVVIFSPILLAIIIISSFCYLSWRFVLKNVHQVGARAGAIMKKWVG